MTASSRFNLFAHMSVLDNLVLAPMQVRPRQSFAETLAESLQMIGPPKHEQSAPQLLVLGKVGKTKAKPKGPKPQKKSFLL